jgi:hypothetical protein
MTNIDKYRADIDSLSKLGDKMLSDLHFRNLEDEGKLKKEEKAEAKELYMTFDINYQQWFTEANAVIRQLIPDRLQEFQDLYKGDSKRKALTLTSYTIQDWLNGLRAGTNNYTQEKSFNDFAAVVMRFSTQLQILKACSKRFESSLFDIRQLVQADLLDSELDSARELAKHRFLRPAGAVIGVVIEKHLLQVSLNHAIQVTKRHPTINDLNELLKNNEVIDTHVWRQIQRLADIRNLCDHNRGREPTSYEVQELIDGADKLTKTIF